MPMLHAPLKLPKKVVRVGVRVGMEPCLASIFDAWRLAGPDAVGSMNETANGTRNLVLEEHKVIEQQMR